MLTMPAPCVSFTDRRGRAVSNCTFDLIGSAVQCTAVKADKSFFHSLEKWLPTEWPEDTGRNKESIVFWPVFVFCWSCEGANGWCSLKHSWWVCVHPLQGLCGLKKACGQQGHKMQGPFLSFLHQGFVQPPLSAASDLRLQISLLGPSDHFTSKTDTSDKTTNSLQRTGLFLGPQLWQ